MRLAACPSLALLCVSLAAIPLSGCPAVFPELGTQMRKFPPGRQLDPPPPDDLYWIRFSSGRVPERTRDGRTWGQAFGTLPDPYAKLLLNGNEILRTSSQSDTMTPTWPDSPSGNFRVTATDKLRVEMWDNNPLNDKPIGVRDIGTLSDDMRVSKQLRAELDGGAEVIIALEPAHAQFGLGLWYELRTSSCFITRMLGGSPAERSGLKKGDEVTRIGGRDVSTLSADEIRSAFNAVPMAGLKLGIRHEDGTTLELTLTEGPIYPSFDEFGPTD
jgi:hypothetical protein